MQECARALSSIYFRGTSRTEGVIAPQLPQEPICSAYEKESSRATTQYVLISLIVASENSSSESIRVENALV